MCSRPACICSWWQLFLCGNVSDGNTKEEASEKNRYLRVMLDLYKILAHKQYTEWWRVTTLTKQASSPYVSSCTISLSSVPLSFSHATVISWQRHPHVLLTLILVSHLRLHTTQFRHQDARGHPRVEVPLELQQLAHEVQIRGHHGATAPHVFVGICHCHEGVLHKVGDDNGCRTRDAGLAVHQHSLSTLICLLCGREQNRWAMGEFRQWKMLQPGELWAALNIKQHPSH